MCKELEPKKLMPLFEIYGRAAGEPSKTIAALKAWNSQGRLWAYARLSDLMISSENIPAYSSSTYAK
jgi:hypothetical protein